MDTPGHRGGEAASLMRGATGMNTTKLITQWTMSGARRDVDGRFRAIADIGALIAANQPAPEPAAAASSFLIKGADGDGWQALEEEEKNHCV